MHKNITGIIGILSLILVCNAGKAQQWDGYTLYSVQNSTSTILMDTSHNTYHTWTHASTAKTGYSSYLMPGGTLVRSVARSGNSFTGGPICGEVQKVDYNGNVLWDFVYSTSTYCTHHDICPMPNGNVLLIAYESKTAAEVTAAGCSTYSATMWPDKIVEVQPTGATTGTVVWEWHAWDHLVQNTNSSAANYQTSIVDHPELLDINHGATKDWMHMNGVDYNPILDQVVFSSHAWSEVFVIDHSTTTAEAASHNGGNSGKGGDILYRWGKPTNYGATGTAVINVCHDAHWIKEGNPHAGYLAYYNNNGISSSASCGDMFQTPVSGYNYSLTQGSAYTPSSYAVRQASGGYNSNMGNIQELPNGNTIVNLGVSGLIKEFNSSGTLLWSKSLTGPNAKAFKYSACYVNNAAPAIPTISENSGALTSSLATTYQWYMNGQQIAGATAQTYTPTQDGIYLVRITDANGCVYEYSAGYNFTLSSGINQSASLLNVKIYPNPSTGRVYVEDGKNAAYTIQAYDAVGKLVAAANNAASIDLSDMDNGIYQLKIISADGQSTYSKIYLSK
jgi:hypothetical protein